MTSNHVKILIQVIQKTRIETQKRTRVMIRIPVKSLFQISHLHLLQFQFEGLLEYGNQEILDRLSQPDTLMNCVDTIFF